MNLAKVNLQQGKLCEKDTQKERHGKKETKDRQTAGQRNRKETQTDSEATQTNRQRLLRQKVRYINRGKHAEILFI